MTFDSMVLDEGQTAPKPADDLMSEISQAISELLLKIQPSVAGGMLTALLMGTVPHVVANSYQTINNKAEIIIDNSGKQLVVHDVASFYFHHDRLHSDMERLSSLRDGWDGCSAKAPSCDALEQAASIIEFFDEKTLAYCAVFPGNDSGLYLQGRFPNGRLSVYLDGEAMTYIIKNKENRISRSLVKVDNNTIEDLQAYIDSLMDENA